MRRPWSPEVLPRFLLSNPISRNDQHLIRRRLANLEDQLQHLRSQTSSSVNPPESLGLGDAIVDTNVSSETTELLIPSIYEADYFEWVIAPAKQRENVRNGGPGTLDLFDCPLGEEVFQSGLF